jgi:hypothetical protein
MTNNEIEIINREMEEVKNIFLNVLKIIPSFDITNPEILPYGLKPHTRSVAWIVEQVITQQTKYHKQQLGISDVEIDMADTCLHDCILHKDGIRYFVNIKIHNIGGRANKNDIAAVEKLYMQYRLNNEYRLIYCAFGFSFQNTTIHFNKEAVHVFSPQFLPIYVNPRNDKIQSLYHHDVIVRSREDFLELLKTKSRSIILT